MSPDILATPKSASTPLVVIGNPPVGPSGHDEGDTSVDQLSEASCVIDGSQDEPSQQNRSRTYFYS